jgi:hypothetical protein
MPETATPSDSNSASQLTADTKKATKRNAMKNLVLTGAACVALGVAVNLLERKFSHDYSTDPDSDDQ